MAATPADFPGFVRQDDRVTCRKCAGSGIYFCAGGRPAACAPCGGGGTVLSRRDQIAFNAVVRDRAAIRDTIITSVERWSDEYYAVMRGWDRLVTTEPHRVPLLCASVANGRVDDSVAALLAYAAT
jgi:hypothetical protein